MTILQNLSNTSLPFTPNLSLSDSHFYLWKTGLVKASRPPNPPLKTFGDFLPSSFIMKSDCPLSYLPKFDGQDYCLSLIKFNLFFTKFIKNKLKSGQFN